MSELDSESCADFEREFHLAMAEADDDFKQCQLLRHARSNRLSNLHAPGALVQPLITELTDIDDDHATTGVKQSRAEPCLRSALVDRTRRRTTIDLKPVEFRPVVLLPYAATVFS
ncbi:hypothetical protein [Saccharopolyspora sp. ASAGF58]|uniref:hypothetical protein n=1 Tax=Saccharopolyspora sp. ASAGF58 TaxID=2719023 RepID=UPI0014487A26|nr:hypothetical protein [Saccharopolyspora sp. ASAGF58]